jgi:hypothetical protein
MVKKVKKVKPGKRGSVADRRKKAARLSLQCQGPIQTLEDIQQSKVKQLERLKKNLATSLTTQLEPRRDAVEDTAAPAFKRRKTEIGAPSSVRMPSQVDSMTLFNHVERIKGKVNWSAVAASFKLNSGQAAKRIYDTHVRVCDSMLPENHDPAPHIHALDLKRKRQLLVMCNPDFVRLS